MVMSCCFFQPIYLRKEGVKQLVNCCVAGFTGFTASRKIAEPVLIKYDRRESEGSKTKQDSAEKADTHCNLK